MRDRNLKVFFKFRTWGSKSGERGIPTIEILKTGNVEMRIWEASGDLIKGVTIISGIEFYCSLHVQ